ncbi:MAG: alpha/beta hydrolase [Gammaproteobacteria bacterium]|nr:alpha/beta hydrolase [Gammaproteobacteria bacterium]
MFKASPTSHIYFSQRLRLHYVDWGNDSAPPLLLIHGGRDHCRNWDWVAERLRDDFHIIAPDLRGHGDSQWMIGGAYSIIDYVYDIAQLVRQTKIEPVTVMGHSLGGSVSLMYTGLYPDSVTKLISIEGMGPIDFAKDNRRFTESCSIGWTTFANCLAEFQGAMQRCKMHFIECRRKIHI